MHWRVMRCSGGCSSLRLFVGGVTTACGWLIILQATRVDGIILQAGREAAGMSHKRLPFSSSSSSFKLGWGSNFNKCYQRQQTRDQDRTGQDGTGEMR